MAVAVDRFDRLAQELFSVFSSIRDGLAVVGACYLLNKTFQVTVCTCSALKTHVISRFLTVDLVKRYGPWAAVTGCTGGIGQAYCMELAARGLNMVLISRSQHELTQLAQHLEKTFDIETITIVADFNEGRNVYQHIRKGIEGKHIGILVNNVGVMYEYPMHFLDVSEDKLWQIIHVNIAAATMMTHMILPRMEVRRRGAVINIASGASSMPAPMIAVYSASKAYLDFFSRALNHEYRPKGITIQCVRPFYVATRMVHYSSSLSNPSVFIPTASTFAKHSLTTLGWSDRTSGYWPHTIQHWLASLIPEWLWMWGATRLNRALQRQAEVRIRHRSGSRSKSRPSSLLYSPGGPSKEPSLLPSSSSSEYMDAPAL